MPDCPSDACTPACSAAAIGPWFVFRGSELLVSIRDGRAEVPVVSDIAGLGLVPVRVQEVGKRDGMPCRSAEVPASAAAPDGWSFAGLRSLFSALPEELFRLAGRALQIVDWERTNQFCGRCGTPTRPKTGERARECPACGQLAYPRISPAIIVSVIDGERILLVRHVRFPQRFTVIAGYVEPGETLEECLHREVREETGIQVDEVRYVANQSWPFPNSLMVGFTARYAGGKVKIDPSEIIEAGWFTADALPAVPDRITIARKLIDAFARGTTTGRAEHEPCG